MTQQAFIIDGKAQAALLRQKVANQVVFLKQHHQLTPGLAVIMVGENPASAVYVRNKIKACEEVGIRSFHEHLDATISEQALLEKVHSLNANSEVHGILVQLPLPSHINPSLIIDAIDPNKDVDGFHPVSMGRLVNGQEGFVPCTPLGCITLLKTIQGTILRDSLAGYKAVVLGRSNIVGKPMGLLLLQADCTVTMLHSKSSNIAEEVKQADIVVAAVGRPEFVKASWLKPGAVVIDVGINKVNNENGTSRLVGDVEFSAAQHIAAAITPVPGGVGPMTIACLVQNTVKALCIQHKLPSIC